MIMVTTHAMVKNEQAVRVCGIGVRAGGNRVRACGIGVRAGGNPAALVESASAPAESASAPADF